MRWTPSRAWWIFLSRGAGQASRTVDLDLIFQLEGIFLHRGYVQLAPAHTPSAPSSHHPFDDHPDDDKTRKKDLCDMMMCLRWPRAGPRIRRAVDATPSRGEQAAKQ